MGRPPLNIDVARKDQRELRTLLKGGVQQVLADHFAKIYKVSLQLAA